MGFRYVIINKLQSWRGRKSTVKQKCMINFVVEQGRDIKSSMKLESEIQSTVKQKCQIQFTMKQECELKSYVK